MRCTRCGNQLTLEEEKYSKYAVPLCDYCYSPQCSAEWADFGHDDEQRGMNQLRL